MFLGMQDFDFAQF